MSFLDRLGVGRYRKAYRQQHECDVETITLQSLQITRHMNEAARLRLENERLKSALKLSNEDRYHKSNEIFDQQMEIETLEKQLSNARAEARIRDKKTGRYVTRAKK